jgi:hypothetical protein
MSLLWVLAPYQQGLVGFQVTYSSRLFKACSRSEFGLGKDPRANPDVGHPVFQWRINFCTRQLAVSAA